MKPNHISCPKCGHLIDVNDLIEKGIQERVKTERKSIEKKIRDQIDEEKTAEIQSYKEQLKLKIKEAKELNKLKAEFERISREKEELQDSLEAAMEKKLTDSLKVEKEKFIKDYDSKTTFKIAEKEHVIKQLKEQLDIALRKANQGSMQIQGEMQELYIEEFLRNTFQSDQITEIPKGEKGGDCIQTVIGLNNEQCGCIYYESKRAKAFKMEWITKFREEVRQAKALYGVIVTDCYPKGVERMTNIQGIWVCSLNEFKGLSQVLRESIMAVYSVVAFQENKGTKTEALYKFLTGNEFKNHLESIVESFCQMQDDLNKEKKSMEAIWKRRSKQLEMVFTNTSQMYGTIRGIAGKAVGTIKLLELTEGKN